MKIPRNLKPGDRLWYSKTEYATVADRLFEPTPYFSDGSIRAVDCYGKAMLYDENGTEICNETPPIIRIERIASAPAERGGEAVSAWIKCSERMPPSGRLVIVFIPRDYNDGTKPSWTMDVDSREYQGDGWHGRDAHEWQPTHWMPLPESPKESKP